MAADAKKLANDLKNATASDQGKAFQQVLGLCKSQDTLVAAMSEATTPSPGVSLLRDILVALHQQNQLVRQILQSSSGKSVPDIATCRDSLLQLAVLPALPPDLIARINATLDAPIGVLDRWRALLAEALSLIYESTDNAYYQLASWHNKLMWLVGCALLFMVGLGVTLHNEVLLLVGGIGGLLSRLQRTVGSSDVANDYGATWGALFLSPLTGGLSAWGGILLIVLAAHFNILGEALTLDWRDPYDPTVLAIALLFGFSERWFDGLASQLQGRIVRPASGTVTSAAPVVAVKPTITSVSPSSASLGKESAAHCERCQLPIGSNSYANR